MKKFGFPFLFWVIPLLILFSCKKNQDSFLGHVWVSDLGTGKLVLKKGEVSFYGKQGTYSSKLIENSKASNHDEGVITLNFDLEKQVFFYKKCLNAFLMG